MHLATLTLASRPNDDGETSGSAVAKCRLFSKAIQKYACHIIAKCIIEPKG